MRLCNLETQQLLDIHVLICSFWVIIPLDERLLFLDPHYTRKATAPDHDLRVEVRNRQSLSCCARQLVESGQVFADASGYLGFGFVHVAFQHRVSNLLCQALIRRPRVAQPRELALAFHCQYSVGTDVVVEKK